MQREFAPNEQPRHGSPTTATGSLDPARSCPRSASALSAQRLGGGHHHPLRPPAWRAMARPARPRRPAAGDVRPGRVRRAVPSLRGRRCTCRWPGHVHAPRLPPVNRPPRRWAHVRAASGRTESPRAHRPGVQRSLLVLHHWRSARRQVFRPVGRLDRSAPRRGPGTAGPLLLLHRVGAGRRPRHPVAPHSRQPLARAT